MPHEPTSGGGAPPHSMPVTCRCNLFREERSKQDVGMWRSPQDQPRYLVRALRDEGATHQLKASPPQRLNLESQKWTFPTRCTWQSTWPTVGTDGPCEGQEVSVYRHARVHHHALRLSSGSKCDHDDDGTGDPLASILRSSHSDLYRRPNFHGSIFQEKCRTNTTVYR